MLDSKLSCSLTAQLQHIIAQHTVFAITASAAAVLTKNDFTVLQCTHTDMHSFVHWYHGIETTAISVRNID